MSIRGARSLRHHAASEATQDLQVNRLTSARVHIIYTHARSHVTYVYVCISHVTESYTENCTCDKMGNRGKMALFFYCASHADMPSVSLVARVIARDGRLELTNRQVQTDRQTDRQITHAAHARRGLMKVQTLGTNIRPGVDGRAKELLRVRSARVNKKSCTAERLVARCLTTL